MKLEIYKMQSTGNDFLVIDGYHQNIQLSQQQIKKLCHRNFGIGADGLIIVEKDPKTSFYMRYYNSDGKIGSFCGNGSRAAVLFFYKIIGFQTPYILGETFTFKAFDGIHFSKILSEAKIMVKFNDLKNIVKNPLGTMINTGSPHLIIPVADSKKIDVFKQGHEIRYSKEFKKAGINVNFCSMKKKSLTTIYNRTYERGVENETLSCGTGNVAAAIAQSIGKQGSFNYKIITFGGNVQVSFESQRNGLFNNIWLNGPSKIVFKTVIDVKTI